MNRIFERVVTGQPAMGQCLLLALGVVWSFASAEVMAQEVVAPEDGARPNVVFIILDDFNDDEFSFVDGPALTPNMQALVDGGMNFTRAYVSTSVCTPSRYTCLTGRYAGRNTSPQLAAGSSVEGQVRVLWNTPVEHHRNNLPRTLQGAGYYTGQVGKWHVGTEGISIGRPPAPGSDPHDPAVNQVLRDHHEAIRQTIMTYGFDHADHVYRGNHHDSTDLRNTGLLFHNMEWLTEGALEFLDQAAAQPDPFYLYWAITLTHWPDPVASLRRDPRESGEGILETPITTVQPSRASVFQRVNEAGLSERYAGALWVDDGIGAVVQRLKDLGIFENTMIILMNDHGSRDYGKGTCYEGGIQTQLVLHWPAGIAHASTSAALVQNIDLVPTILDAAGVTAPEDLPLDGMSLLPLVRSTGAETEWRDAVFSEIGYTRAVTTERWKYLAFRVPPSHDLPLAERLALQDQELASMMERNGWYAGEADPEARMTHLGLAPGGAYMTRLMLYADPTPVFMPHYYDADQLFDLHADPGESRNLADDPEYAEVLADMKARLSEHLNTMPGPFGAFTDGSMNENAADVQTGD